MAVYTKVSEAEAALFLSAYDIGELTALTGIKTGVQNSNYRLQTDRGLYVLTLYEGPALGSDLDYFVGLMEYLAAHSTPCPQPIRGKDGMARRMLAGRPAVIVSFLEGTSPVRVQPEDCFELGKGLAALHKAGHGFDQHRENDLSLGGWDKLFSASAAKANTVMPGLADILRTELAHLHTEWPDDLPSGVIHADLFPDNVFFDSDKDGGKLCGLIDFNFACNDFLAYDLAICLNAWCFENNNMSFNITKARAMLQGYTSVRQLDDAERAALPLLARGAAVRFLLKRLYDWLHQVPGALVRPKDPLEYLTRLKFHQRVESIADYGL
jgi:homoserine kinase type II